MGWYLVNFFFIYNFFKIENKRDSASQTLRLLRKRRKIRKNASELFRPILRDILCS